MEGDVSMVRTSVGSAIMNVFGQDFGTERSFAQPVVERLGEIREERKSPLFCGAEQRLGVA